MATAPDTTVTAQSMADEVVEVFIRLKAVTADIKDTEKHLWSMAVSIVTTVHELANKTR
jgi:hypothetical protein